MCSDQCKTDRSSREKARPPVRSVSSAGCNWGKSLSTTLQLALLDGSSGICTTGWALSACTRPCLKLLLLNMAVIYCLTDTCCTDRYLCNAHQMQAAQTHVESRGHNAISGGNDSGDKASASQSRQVWQLLNGTGVPEQSLGSLRGAEAQPAPPKPSTSAKCAVQHRIWQQPRPAAPVAV